MTSGPITLWQIEWEKWKQWQTLFSWSPKSMQMVTAAIKLRHLQLRRKVMTNLGSVVKSRDITLPTEVHVVKAMVFQESCMVWELDHKEGWAPKNCSFRTVVLGKTLESLLDCKEIIRDNPKGNQSFIFIGSTDAEAPIFWPTH